MADMPDDKYIKRFAKNHGLSQSDVRDLIRDNPTNWESVLDTKAFSSAAGRLGEDAMKGIDPKNMRHLTEDGVKRYAKMTGVDAKKDKGLGLTGYGAKTGFGNSIDQVNKASRGQRWAKVAEAANPFGAPSRSALSDSVGWSGGNTKALAAKGSLMNKISRRVLLPGAGLITAYDALQSEDPLNNFATVSAGGWGLQYGYGLGKAVTDATIGPSKIGRLVGGGGLAVAGAAAAAGTMWAIGDMGKNDSTMTKKAKTFYKRETFAASKDTQETLTMRRAALNKLSSSSLNNRGQLLGNEANILKNAQY